MSTQRQQPAASSHQAEIWLPLYCRVKSQLSWSQHISVMTAAAVFISAVNEPSRSYTGLRIFANRTSRWLWSFDIADKRPNFTSTMFYIVSCPFTIKCLYKWILNCESSSSHFQQDGDGGLNRGVLRALWNWNYRIHRVHAAVMGSWCNGQIIEP